jgi:TatA/E family protein of Tat protein translocase
MRAKYVHFTTGTLQGTFTAAPSASKTRQEMPTDSQQIVPTRLTHCRFSFPGSMMNRMSFSETIFLFFLALIIFGPKKLPEIARQIGKYMNEFKRASNEFKAQIEQEISHLEVEQRQTILPPSPPPEGATSRKLNAAPVETAAAEDHPVEIPTNPDAATQAATEVGSPVAVAEDEPLFAGRADAGATSDGVAAPTSQESHV